MSAPVLNWRPAAAAIVVLCAVYVAAAASVRPSLLPDPAYGLLVDKSMRHGAPWNHMTEPRADDLARDRTYFYAVWSPGQYAVPALLIDAGVPTGIAASLVAVVASLVGLAGWLWLFRVLGWDTAVAWSACALIAASRSFNYSFLAYVGSDVLAFAVFPFLAGGLVKLQDSVWLTPFAVIAMFAAFFAKNSLPVYVGAWVAAQSLFRFRPGAARPVTLMRLAPLIAAAAVMVFIQWAYNSRGWNPIAYDPAPSLEAYKYVLPWAMPALAATSWDDVLNWLFNHPSAPVTAFEYKRSLPLVGSIAAIAIAGVVVAVRRHYAASRVAAGFSVIVLAFFTALLGTGSAASLDLSRHYRIVGYVWLPAIVYWMLTRRRPAAIALAAALLLPCVYGVASFASNWRRHDAHSASHSPRIQITHLDASPRVVEMLALLDRELPRPSSLVVTPAPAHALEFDLTRVLATSAVSDTLTAIQSNRHHGTVDNLVVIAEIAGMAELTQQAWLQSFASYHVWESVDLDTHRFYVPAGQPVGVSWLRERIDRLAD